MCTLGELRPLERGNDDEEDIRASDADRGRFFQDYRLGHQQGA
jgi:hypothetical protein